MTAPKKPIKSSTAKSVEDRDLLSDNATEEIKNRKSFTDDEDDDYDVALDDLDTFDDYIEDEDDNF